MAALLSLPERSVPVAPAAKPMVTVAAQPAVLPPIPTAPAKPLPQAWERKVEPVAGGAPPGQAGVWSHAAEFAPPE